MLSVADLTKRTVRHGFRVQLIRPATIDGGPIRWADRATWVGNVGTVVSINTENDRIVSVGVCMDGAAKNIVLDAACLGYDRPPDLTNPAVVAAWLQQP